MRTDPERFLAWMAEQALAQASTGRRRQLVASTFSLQAVANAFVMLRLLPEGRAEAVLDRHRHALAERGLEPRGVAEGELTLVPGSAHGYPSPGSGIGRDLAQVPVAVAAGPHWDLSPTEVILDWVVLTPAALRLRATARSGRGHRPAAAGARSHRDPLDAMLRTAVIDNAGRSYRLRPVGGDRGSDSGGLWWEGELVADPPPPEGISWLEFSPSRQGSLATRVTFAPPQPAPVEAIDPPWSTAAECYLDWLTPGQSVHEIGSGHGVTRLRTAPVMASVADALLAVGALPPDSSLLRRSPRPSEADWQAGLRDRWAGRVLRDFNGWSPAGRRLALGVHFPLRSAKVVIEGMSVDGGVVRLWIYAWPWPHGEYWPVAVPGFKLSAVDDTGADHGFIPGGSHGYHPSLEGTGDFLLWPPLAKTARRLRIVASTLWEAASADFDLTNAVRE